MRRRDCRAWLEHDGVSVAQCAQIGPHDVHAGLDPDARFVTWRDTNEGARNDAD